jgi:flagellar motor switch protein FliM
VRVRVQPVLRAGRLSVGEMAQLTAGTVVRLDAGETAPFELRVEGQRVFSGAIARCERHTTFSPIARRGLGAPGTDESERKEGPR